MTDERLPDHPEEKQLRKAELEMATTLRQLTKKVGDALERHQRIEAFTLLAQLEEVAKQAKFAMARATQDQMDLAAGKEPGEST